jgi:predicted Rossmann fold flavoprotein
MKTDVIIIGAGASGLMCAIEAGKRGRKVLVLEHADAICGKVAISGGGRCNFTNSNVRRENYISNNLHFAVSALARFVPSDFISLLEKHHIRFHEKEAGQLFCDGSSREIIDMLKAECEMASVEFLMGCTVSEVHKEKGFEVLTNQGSFHCESLVIATGGLSMPNMGATNFGYALAKQFGMRVTALRPALTSLKFNREDRQIFSVLAGTSIHSTVSYKGAEFRDNILFTHTGLSGPAILQISSYWDGEGGITVDLLPDIDIHGILIEKHHGTMLLSTLLDQYLPKRFVKIWCDLYSKSRPLNQYSMKEFESVANGLHNWQIRAECKEGFNKAEVTLGGVDTGELSSRTMESKKVPGLYFIGEVIDVTGQLGGYNLHWAWASGYAAGQYV